MGRYDVTICCGLEQGPARLSHKQEVEGSSPSSATILFPYFFTMSDTVAPESEELNAPDTPETPKADTVEAPSTVHDPVVMANEFRRQLKEFE